MNHAACALVASLLVTYAGASASVDDLEVRVRLQRGKSNIEITGMGLNISPPSPFMAISSGQNGLSRAMISRKNGTWLVRSDSTEPQRFEGNRLAVRGQMLRIGLEPVPYDLEVLPNPKGGLDVVAKLDMESYLAGVLPSEMPASWPIEALKAQAVAARSFVLRTAHERRRRHFDVDSTVMDQVYRFLHEAKSHPEWKARITKVINDTRGEVLVDDKNRVVKAFYSADCGCQTEDPKFVWGKVEALQSVTDPTCSKRQPRQWNLNLAKQELRTKLIAFHNLPPRAELRTVQISGRTPSGRVAGVVAAMQVDGDTQHIHMNSQEFRKMIGFERVRSTDFKLRWLGKTMQILGTGMGHGVGLCQTGAKALAESGMNYRDILKLYYPKVRLTYRDKLSTKPNPRQSSVFRRFRELG